MTLTNPIDEKIWRELERRSQSDTGDAEEDAYNIGVADGFSQAVQSIDRLTGGDGEYRYNTLHDPERHCPDPDAMIARISARFAALSTLQEQKRKIEETLREIVDETKYFEHPALRAAHRIATRALLSGGGE